MPTSWACPKCKRRFTRKNQRHACGASDGADVLRNRSPELVALYAELEKFIRTLGSVEFVARERYVLFRSARIFADLVVMSDALRLALHLAREANDPLFFKVVADKRHVTHVAKLRTPKELQQLKPYLRRAYADALS